MPQTQSPETPADSGTVPAPTHPATPIEVAERVVGAHDRFDRCLANLRNAVALPDDDPRGRDVMVDKAVDAYTLALVYLDEVQGYQRAAVPVDRTQRVDVEPAVEAAEAPPAGPPIEQPPAADRGAA